MAGTDQITEQEVIATYRGLKSEIKQLAEKIAELEMDVNEHTRVMETLAPLDPSRKAFRMIGGVLVERTVQEVLPAVETNKNGIIEVLKSLSERLKDRETKAAEWQVSCNVFYFFYVFLN